MQTRAKDQAKYKRKDMRHDSHNEFDSGKVPPGDQPVVMQEKHSSAMQRKAFITIFLSAGLCA